MANWRENLNLQSKTRELMDQPSVQHNHIMTIPTALDASSVESSSASALPIGFQTLNSLLGVPGEDVPIDMATSGASNVQASRSLAPRHQRSQWNNPSYWLIFDFNCTIIQLFLLVVFLFVFPHEHPHAALLVWVIGYGVGCLAALPLLYCTYKRLIEQSNRLPQIILTASPGSERDESESGQHRRFGKILKWLWRSLHVFFVLWFGVGVGIVATRWATRQAPHLSWLCLVLIVFGCYRFILPWSIYIVMRCFGMGEWRQGTKANVISALPTYKFHAQVSNLETTYQANKEDNDMRVSIERDPRVGALAAAEVVECCICLDPYEEGVEVKELPCMHYFHVKCIDRWLKLYRSCPTCKSELSR